MAPTTPGRPTPDRTIRRGREAGPARAPGPEDERLPLGRTTAYDFQHVLTMYGAIVAVPLVVGQAAGLSGEEIALLISSCLLMGGVATVLQSFGALFLGSRLPLVQGVSFAGVAPCSRSWRGGQRPDHHLRGRPRLLGGGIPARRRVLPDPPALPAGGHRNGHHGHRHLPAAGRDLLGRR